MTHGELTELVLKMSWGPARASAFIDASIIARKYAEIDHGALPTDPREAVAQAAREIEAAIIAMVKT